MVRRAPQVMVKVASGGRGLKAIAAHFRYISNDVGLDVEDGGGEPMRGKRLNPRKADPPPLARDVRCEVTRPWCRGRSNSAGDTWMHPQLRPAVTREGQGRWSAAHEPANDQGGAATAATRAAAVDAWREIARAMAASGDKADRDLAHAVAKYVGDVPAVAGTERAGASPVPFEPTRQVDQQYQK